MNTFGRYFRCTMFGESHGPALGVVVDGCPPEVPFGTEHLKPLMERRRPGKSPLSTPRDEADEVEILSGIFQGETTGMPVAMIVRNRDAQSSAYDTLRDTARPGHADLAYHQKYGYRDHRGGGRSSGRETVSRVMAGALAMQVLATRGITIDSRVCEVGGETDPDRFAEVILRAKGEHDSVGGILEVTATGCPPGLGAPAAGKLDAELGHAMFSIGAVKGVEIGSGFAAARMRGSEHNDPITSAGYVSNNAGGILGGISTGAPIVVRIAVKPTPSIAQPQQTVTMDLKDTMVTVEGRHDSCIVPRIGVVAESMLALVLTEALCEQTIVQGFRSRSG
ncbi:chorismate synthase [Methanogenium organophilum]|uniref:Chorismate synthase n=1 Tax=Methanogenium organophilum TaxID=2199 RepID=A0A9X9T8R3_METOG|nr:chorismate synthase [Methanogenium organophilum]WAI01930.1 chorismate synthase [Methanogenium organophilum]